MNPLSTDVPERGWSARRFIERALPRPAHLTVAVWAAVLVGAAVQFLLVWPAGFPANDGGMFAVMVGDIRANGLALPTHSTYNGIGLPFAYPPLALWVAAAVQKTTAMSTAHLLMLIPLLASVAAIPAFFLLARAVLPSRRAVGISVWVFALVPRRFSWEVTGGGLTRSPGFLVAVLATWQIWLLIQKPTKARLGVSAVLATLAALCHPEMGLFVAIAGVCFGAVSERRREATKSLLTVAVLCAALSSPWWIWVVTAVGPSAFVSAATTGGHSSGLFLQIVSPSVFGEPMFPLIAGLGFLGILNCLARRAWMLPLWYVAIFLVDPRKAGTDATVPLAMLAAIALDEVLLPLTRSIATRERPGGYVAAENSHATVGRERILLYAVFGFALVAALGSPFAKKSPLRSLAGETRGEMASIASVTPENARFIVVTGDDDWSRDAVSEWFPALAQRRSLATVQGYEWLGGGNFRLHVDSYAALQLCAASDASCLTRWSAQFATGYDFVYIPKTPYQGMAISDDDPDRSAALRLSLSMSPAYRTVAELPEGVLFARVD